MRPTAHRSDRTRFFHINRHLSTDSNQVIHANCRIALAARVTCGSSWSDDPDCHNDSQGYQLLNRPGRLEPIGRGLLCLLKVQRAADPLFRP